MGTPNPTLRKMLAKIFVVVALAVLATRAAAALPKPYWPDTFMANISITAQGEGPVVEGTYAVSMVDGVYVSVQVMPSGDDFLCSTVYNETTPCVDVASTEERFLYFPEKDECCSCCNVTSSTAACGALVPSWVSSGQYLGDHIVGDEICQMFLVMGDVVEWITYDLATYTTDVPASTFDVPSACT